MRKHLEPEHAMKACLSGKVQVRINYDLPDGDYVEPVVLKGYFCPFGFIADWVDIFYWDDLFYAKCLRPYYYDEPLALESRFDLTVISDNPHNDGFRLTVKKPREPAVLELIK